MPESDPARWQALVAVAEMRAQVLRDAGAADADTEALDAVAAGTLHAGRIRRAFVLLADPDPLQRTMLHALAGQGMPVVVAVHAVGTELPEPLRDDGFIDHERWSRARIAVPDDSIAVAATPADQAAAVMDALSAIPAPVTTADVAIAVPDQEVAAEVAARLPAWGVAVTAPPGRMASDSSLGALVGALERWVDSRVCDALGGLGRPPDVERWLASDGIPDAVERCAGFAAATGARTVPDDTSIAAMADVREVVDAVDRLCAPLRAARDAAGSAAALRSLLDALVRPRGPVSVDAGRAAVDAISELEELPAALGAGLAAGASLRLVQESMAAASLPTEGTEDGIELMGWLDAGIDDAPHVVVTGMNEGTVPEGMVVDPWLPDSARERLGMTCARRRQARDAWILHALLARKRSLRLVCGRTGADGEPRQPSRLLLGEQGEELARRVLWIADERSARASAARWQSAAPLHGGFGPSPVPEGAAQIDTLSVTSFRDWFISPDLLRLKRDRRLRLDAGSEPAHELDPMAFGTLVHAALERWGQEAAERTREGRPPATDRGAIERDVLRAFADVRSQCFVPEVRGAYRVQFALAEERLRAFARVQAAHAAAGWRVAHAELNFGAQRGAQKAPIIGPSRLRLTGRIDRVDLHPELGHAAIDYKTAPEAKEPEPEHRRKDGGWIDLQLPLYRVLLREMGIDVAPQRLGYFALPSNPSAAAILMATAWDLVLVDDAEAEARRIAKLVEAGDFSEGPAYEPRDDDPFGTVWCVGMRGLRAEAAR
jgi:ATP-dependent helicase/nuclease subunit B